MSTFYLSLKRLCLLQENLGLIVFPSLSQMELWTQLADSFMFSASSGLILSQKRNPASDFSAIHEPENVSVVFWIGSHLNQNIFGSYCSRSMFTPIQFKSCQCNFNKVPMMFNSLGGRNEPKRLSVVSNQQYSSERSTKSQI